MFKKWKLDCVRCLRECIPSAQHLVTRKQVANMPIASELPLGLHKEKIVQDEVSVSYIMSKYQNIKHVIYSLKWWQQSSGTAMHVLKVIYANILVIYNKCMLKCFSRAITSAHSYCKSVAIPPCPVLPRQNLCQVLHIHVFQVLKTRG